MLKFFGLSFLCLFLYQSHAFALDCSSTDALGQRRSFVVAVMNDSGTTLPASSWVRLANYTFRILADGTCSVREDFWFWNQSNSSPSNLTMSAGAGLFPSCLTADGCQIWTAKGFEDGNATYPKALFGTYVVNAGSVTITWTGGSTETWDIASYPAQKVAKLSFASSNYGVDYGFGWGSKKDVSFYAPMSQVATKRYPNVTYYQNNYGVVDQGSTFLGTATPFDLQWLMTRCTDGNCFVRRVLSSVAPGSYDFFVGGGSSRKNYFNHQYDSVDGGISSPCIGAYPSGIGKGHLKPALQVIDDDGNFRGWVKVEASMYAFTYGSAILGIYDINDIVYP